MLYHMLYHAISCYIYICFWDVKKDPWPLRTADAKLWTGQQLNQLTASDYIDGFFCCLQRSHVSPLPAIIMLNDG